MRFELLKLDQVTPAGNVYPKDVILRSLSKLERPLLVYLGSSEDGLPSLRNAAGQAKLNVYGDLLVAEVEWLDTSKGRIAKELCESSADIRLSTSGWAECVEEDGAQMVKGDFEWSHLQLTCPGELIDRNLTYEEAN